MKFKPLLILALACSVSVGASAQFFKRPAPVDAAPAVNLTVLPPAKTVAPEPAKAAPQVEKAAAPSTPSRAVIESDKQRETPVKKVEKVKPKKVEKQPIEKENKSAEISIQPHQNKKTQPVVRDELLEGCAGRAGFAHDMCISLSCLKPAFHAHPICRDLTEKSRKREEERANMFGNG